MTRHQKILYLILGIVAVLSLGAVWNNAGYEGAYGTSGIINDSTPANQIDDFIRNERNEQRARHEVEHHFGADASDDNGTHRVGSARCFTGNTAPTTTEVTDYDNTTNAVAGSGTSTLTANATNSSPAEALGLGRCWIDGDGLDNTAGTIDDNQLYWHDGSAFVAVSSIPDRQDDIVAGRFNLAFNGDFEATDGTGAAASTTVPAGWANSGGTSPTYAYVASDDPTFGDGLYLSITNSGAIDEAVEISITNLKANTVYKALARAEDDGVAVCTLDVTGEGGTAFTPAATTTDAWETLSGTFGTAASLDTVAVTLTTTGADTQACNFDHITVVEQGTVTVARPEIWEGGVVALRDTGTATTACADDWTTCAAIVSVSFTASRPGYAPSLNGLVSVDPLAENTDCTVRIFDGSSALQLVGVQSTDSGQFPLPISYLGTTPVALGSTVTYQLDVYGSGCTLDATTPAGTTSHYLNALMMPTM